MPCHSREACPRESGEREPKKVVVDPRFRGDDKYPC